MQLTTVQSQQLSKVADNVWIYRVPNPVYQMFADMVPQMSLRTNLEDTKARIMKELKAFISDKFPGMVIVDIADFNKVEAEAIHPKLQWGMYVQLAEGHYEGTIGLENSLKQLEYGY